MYRMVQFCTFAAGRSASGDLPFTAAHYIQPLADVIKGSDPLMTPLSLVTAAHEAAAGHGSRSRFRPASKIKKVSDLDNFIFVLSVYLD